MGPASFFNMWSLSSKMRKKLVANQHPELGRQVAHAAATRSQDQQQHLERVVVPEEKGFGD